MAGGIIDPERLQSAALEPEEFQRYARHLSIPEFGQKAQEALKASRVLCIGAGGLGSPIAMYLAAAGVGRMGIVDPDVVDLSNLQRQLLHGTGDVGRKKLESAKERIHDINPHVQVDTYDAFFKAETAMEIAEPYDLIIDGTDNFPTRYLSNDICVFLRKPNVYGSIFRFEGQTTVFAPHLGGPCYRCMFPTPPEPGLVPSCAEGGVLGILPGLIGVIQATEAVKLLTGIGEPLISRLLHIDALPMRFREFKLKRDPQCPVCSESPSITEPIDYEAFCGLTPDAPQDPVADELTVQVLAEKLKANDNTFVLLDVRESFERAISTIPGAIHIPLGELAARLEELDPSAETAIHCKSGARSAEATQMLKNAGFARAANVIGGIDAWAREIDPTVPTY